MPAGNPTQTKRLYTRALASGGYVAIEAHPVRSLFGSEKIRGELIVERRCEARRQGHRAPVAAVAEQLRFRDVIVALFPIAHSDQALSNVLARNVTVTVAAGRTRKFTSDTP